MPKKDSSLARVRGMAKRFVHPFRVTKGKRFRLKDVDPADTRGLDYDKKKATALLDRGKVLLAELQDKLYAQDRWGVLIVFQAMDAAGKDGTARQKLPPDLVTKRIWEERYEDINAFERYLARQGFVILKFFLHVSKDEQRARFLKRLDEPEKNWKFSAADVAERAHWREYMNAYEDAIRATAAPHAPWYVVPADHKWFTRLVVAGAIVDALAELDLQYPAVSRAQRAQLREARRALVGERG